MVVATAAAALWMRNSASGAGDLRDRRQRRGGAAVWRQPAAHRRHGVRAARLLRRRRDAGLCDPASRHPVDHPAGLELTVITAAVVGGVSILGGVGTVVGATLAAILIAEITSALVFINVSPYWTDALRGGLILATVIADILRRQRRAARGRRI